MIAETVGKALLSILYFLLVTCATLGIPEQRDDERGENDAR